jgi:pilus assembly protein Flp/PilA
MNGRLWRFKSEESGQTLVEYALILMLVTLLTITALTSIGTTVSAFFTNAATGLGGA